MNILAIDTSNHVLGIAILSEGQIIGEFVTNLKKGHSVRLMPAIVHLMNEVNITPNELNKIVVAKGPGSYTGVRIGLTTAKTLAWSLNIPIVGVSSLEVLAYQGRLFNSLICPFFDARRDTVYTASYEWNNNELFAVDKELNILMKEWLEKIALNSKKILFLSSDLDTYKEMIDYYIGDLAVYPEAPYHIANPSHLALAGLKKDSNHIHTLAPNYLRLAEAEANWLKAEKERRKHG